MDLRGDLKTIKNTLRGPTSDNGSWNSASDSSIELKADYGCKAVDCNTCSVCLEKRCNTMLLPCSHQFHAECIIQWTERQFSCPMCRTEISHFVPLRNMKSTQEADFVKLWENHYMTPPLPKRANFSHQDRSIEEEQKSESDDEFEFLNCTQRPQTVSHVTKKDVQVAGAAPMGSLKRTPSLSMLKHSIREPDECKSCKGSLKNEFVYFAFDHKFCSTPCRLKYARSSMPKKHGGEDGTASFYVDFSQVMKYITSNRSSEYIDVREMNDDDY